MANGKVGISKEHGVDSCGNPAECSINSRGCTGKGETQSRIGPDAIAPHKDRPMNYNRTKKGWKDRGHSQQYS